MTQETQRELVERYDRYAGAYREFWAPVLRVPAAMLLDAVGDLQAKYVLEVGTGVGTLIPDTQAAFPSARIVGCDRSMGMLRKAPRTLPRAVMDAANLAVGAETMDAVVMVFMLFHLEDPAAGLREAARVLRAKGRLGVLTWGGEFESKAMRVWSACLDEHGAKPADPQSRGELVGTPDKLRALIHLAGLHPERVWREEMVSEIPVDQLVGIKTGLGREKARFDSIAEDAQVACVGEARKRMARLESGDFIVRGPIVYAVAAKEPSYG